MFPGDGEEVFFVGHFVADKGAVGFDDDVVVAAVFDDFALLVPGVELRGERLVDFWYFIIGTRQGIPRSD